MNKNQKKLYDSLLQHPPVWPNGQRRTGSTTYNVFWLAVDGIKASWIIPGSTVMAAYWAGKEYARRNKMTITIRKPLDIKMTVYYPGEKGGHTYIYIRDKKYDKYFEPYSLPTVELLFKDLETLKDFAQAIVGFTAKAEMDGQL